MQKRCFKCGETKPIDEFYKHPQMADGHLGKCKSCTKRDVAVRYRTPEGRAKCVAHDKERSQRESRKQKRIEYQRKARANSPARYCAWSAVNNAVRDGRLIKLPCEICGDIQSEAHHADYRRPLHVRWLCFQHHREVEHGQTVTKR